MPSQQAQTMAFPQRLPLMEPLETRSALPFVGLTKAARLINGYAEKTPDGYDIYKRYGLAVNRTVTAGQARGLYFSAPTNTELFVVAGELYESFTSGMSVSAVDNTTPLGYFFEDIASSPKTIVLSDGVSGYVYTPGVSLVQITDPNYPAVTVRGWAYLDGFLYTMDPQGNIWGTDGTDNALVWSALNLIEASSNADLGVGLVKNLSYIIAFKQWTTQIFYDAGNPPPGSPLGPIPEAQLAYGCFSNQTIQQIGATVIWVTLNKNMGPQVARMDGLDTKIISTPSVERILQTVADNPSNTNIFISSFAFRHGGHSMYGVTFVEENITLVYDLDQNLWYPWTDQLGNYWPIFAVASSGATAQQSIAFAQGYDNGVIYQLDTCDQLPTDAGTIIPVDVYTPNYDAGVNRRKQCGMLWLRADQQVGSIIYERHSDDDFNTWSKPRQIDMSRKRPYLKDLGTFNRRAFNFRHQCATALRIRTVDLQMDVGTL